MTKRDYFPNGIVSGNYSGVYLANLSFSSGITKLGDNCFEKAVIPNELNLTDTINFGTSCFKGSKLQNINLKINENQNLGYSLFEAVTAYDGGKTKITITGNSTPEKINDLLVKSGIDIIDLTNTNYKTLEYYLRDGNFQNIYLPDNLTEYSDYSFTNCQKLTDFTIGNTVTTIGRSCFDGCKSIKELFIPKNVTTLYANCFDFAGVGLVDPKTDGIVVKMESSTPPEIIYSDIPKDYYSYSPPPDKAPLHGKTKVKFLVPKGSEYDYYNAFQITRTGIGTLEEY